MLSYRIRLKAQLDLDRIWEYSLRQWGKAHASNYMADLKKLLALIGDNPRLGRVVDEFPGFFVMPHGAHLVFYLIAEDGVPEIVRIPSSRRDRETISPDLF